MRNEGPEKVTSSFPEALGLLGRSELTGEVEDWAWPVTSTGWPDAMTGNWRRASGNLPPAEATTSLSIQPHGWW